MLICLFGNNPLEWTERFKQITAMFAKHLPNTGFELAHPEYFKYQISKADIIYMNDGDNLIMEHIMRQFTNLDTAFLDKTVVASSAGANILSTDYYTPTYSMVRQGLGVLPIKFMAHYGAPLPHIPPTDWQAAKQALAIHGDTTQPLFTLGEGEFIEINENGIVQN
jgi:hypothetical protein